MEQHEAHQIIASAAISGNKGKQRIVSFDLLKGIAIFLVVAGHVITMCIRGIDSAFAIKLIGEVHMPIFFFISGYLTYKASKDGARAFAAPNLKKRFCQLIIPFAVIMPLWYWYFPHSHLLSPLCKSFTGMFQAYWKDGYWFTLCLFELFLLYWPLSWLMSRCKRTWQQVAVAVAAYAVLVAIVLGCGISEDGPDWLGLGLLARFCPMFMIGIFAHRLSQWWTRLWHNEWWLLGAVLAFGLTWYSLVYPWDMPWLPAWAAFITRPAMHFALMLIALAVVEPWANKEYRTAGHKPSIVARYFNYLGHESLGIYITQYFFLFPLTVLQEPMRMMGLANVPLVVVSFTVAFFIVALSLLAIRLISCSHTLAFLLLGKPLYVSNRRFDM